MKTEENQGKVVEERHRLGEKLIDRQNMDDRKTGREGGREREREGQSRQSLNLAREEDGECKGRIIDRERAKSQKKIKRKGNRDRKEERK